MTTSLRSLELRALSVTDGHANKRAAELRAVVVQQGNVYLVPGAGTLTLTGYASGIAQPQAVTPAVGSVTITGYAPGIAQPQAITPSVGSVALTGYAPSIAQPQATTPSVGSVALTGYAPGIAQPQAITPSVGSVALAGYAPSLAGVVQVSPAAGAISLSGLAPSVSQSTIFRAKLTPDVWLKTLIDEIMAVPLADEFMQLEHQPEGCIILEIPDSDITTRQMDYSHVTVVPESYSTTMAEELYFVASELVP